MAERIERFTTVVAAGAAGTSVPHTFIDGIVTRVELYVPDGHAGMTEWSFWYGDGQLLPKTAGSVVVANDRKFEWDVENAPEGGDYRSVVSNTDVIAHRFYVEVWLEEFGADEPGQTQPILVLPAPGE